MGSRQLGLQTDHQLGEYQGSHRLGQGHSRKKKGVCNRKIKSQRDPEALQSRDVLLTEPIPRWSREGGTLKASFFDVLLPTAQQRQADLQPRSQ